MLAVKTSWADTTLCLATWEFPLLEKCYLSVMVPFFSLSQQPFHTFFQSRRGSGKEYDIPCPLSAEEGVG